MSDEPEPDPPTWWAVYRLDDPESWKHCQRDTLVDALRDGARALRSDRSKVWAVWIAPPRDPSGKLTQDERKTILHHVKWSVEQRKLNEA